MRPDFEEQRLEESPKQQRGREPDDNTNGDDGNALAHDDGDDLL